MKIEEKIKIPIYKEMETFERKFSKSMFSKVSILNKIINFLLKRKGKQMRPMLVFLSAKLLAKAHNINEKTYRGASVVELIHTATLVHDDVVDDSNQRRGFFSINALWKNKIAVLVGDYLLSKGLLISIDNSDFDLLKIISVAVREMSQGEILQIEKSRELNITEDEYFTIIKQKTASLMAACCAIGAKSVTNSESKVLDLYKIGELIGIAFQIKDDLFDYGNARIGKPRGNDIKQKKITLPLIYSLNVADYNEKKWLLNAIKKRSNDKKTVKEVIKKVMKLGGVKYATESMLSYKNKAINLLGTFPKNQYRDAMELMINYVVERKL